jgi:hypothetical protein
MGNESNFIVKKVESGPAKVIDSGTVISFAGNPITMRYKDLDITIIIEFKTDNQNISSYFDRNIPNRGTLKLTLYNFDASFGAGTIKPMPIGKYEGKKLYIQFRVYALTDSPDKTLHYTIYKGEEVSESGHA